MFAAAFAATGLDGWSYQRLPVPPELFAETARALGAAGFRGANVTIPHKEAALALADDADRPRAGHRRRQHAHLRRRGHPRRQHGRARADRLAARAAGRKDGLVLGAGGSARAAVWAPARRRGGRGPGVEPHARARRGARRGARRAGGRDAAPADLLVNCTSVGLEQPSQTFKELPISAEAIVDYQWVADLVYTQDETAIVSPRLRLGQR